MSELFIQESCISAPGNPGLCFDWNHSLILFCHLHELSWMTPFKSARGRKKNPPMWQSELELVSIMKPYSTSPESRVQQNIYNGHWIIRLWRIYFHNAKSKCWFCSCHMLLNMKSFYTQKQLSFLLRIFTNNYKEIAHQIKHDIWK